MFNQVLELVKKGYTIRQSIKKCGYHSRIFYSNITEKQKQILRINKFLHYPYFRASDSLQEKIHLCITRINLIDNNYEKRKHV